MNSKSLAVLRELLAAHDSLIHDRFDGTNELDERLEVCERARQVLDGLVSVVVDRSALPGEYFALAAPSMRGQVIILCRTTGEQAAHTPKFKAEEAHLALHAVDALNDAYAAGILQGNRTRPQVQWASGQTYEGGAEDESRAHLRELRARAAIRGPVVAQSGEYGMFDLKDADGFTLARDLDGPSEALYVAALLNRAADFLGAK